MDNLSEHVRKNDIRRTISSPTINIDNLTILPRIETKEKRLSLSRHFSLRRTDTSFPTTSTIIDTVQLNVGGSIFVTSLKTLTREKFTLFSELSFREQKKDKSGRIFIDRDGDLFEHIISYLRTGVLELPDDFQEHKQLLNEAKYYRIPSLIKIIINDYIFEPIAAEDFSLLDTTTSKGSYITLTVHSNYNIRTRDNQQESIFDRIASMTLAGHVLTCMILFRQYLNMDRDANNENDRYSCRMLLKNLNLPNCFKMLYDNQFLLQSTHKIDSAISNCREEVTDRWIHATVYTFLREITVKVEI